MTTSPLRGLRVKEVTDPRDPLFHEYYRKVYLSSFPLKEDELPEEEFLETIRREAGGKLPGLDYHVLIAMHRGRIAGGAIGSWHRCSGRCIGVLEYLDVAEGYRGRGLGSYLERYFGGYLERESRREAKRPLFGIVAETHNPSLMGGRQKRKDAMDPESRLAFFRKLGYKRVDFDYVCPWVNHGRPCHYFLLVKLRNDARRIPKRVVLDLLRHYVWRDGFGKDPRGCKELRSIQRRLRSQRYLRLVDL